MFWRSVGGPGFFAGKEETGESDSYVSEGLDQDEEGGESGGISKELKFSLSLTEKTTANLFDRRLSL